MAQLMTAAAQGNDSYTGIAARDTASALKVLANAVRGVAATSDEPKDQQAILKAAKLVMQESANLIEEAKRALENPNDPDNQQKLAQVIFFFLDVMDDVLVSVLLTWNIIHTLFCCFHC